jgi:excinuclease ABC subunit C
MTKKILEKYKQSPHSPGVYLMKDAKGNIIYVGKAKDLKKRLSSYFVKKHNHDPKTAALLEMIKDFDMVMTSSGHEAFILESNLIKEHNPKYNVILKDGKNYPLLRINMNEKYPEIQKVRKIKNDKAIYFGPYSSAYSVNRTLKQIQKIFRLRKCKNTQFKNRSRPCLNFQIKSCLGLCCNDVKSSEYKKTVKDAILFLKGQSKQVVKKLKEEMFGHSSHHEFEKAAELRDTIFAIENVMEKQVVVCPDMKDRDVMAFSASTGKAVITVLIVRTGQLVDTACYPVNLGFKEPDEILSAFVEQYYKENLFVPSFILLGQDIENRDALEKSLGQRKGKKVKISIPVRGEKKRLVEMARINATRELEKIILKEKEERASIFILKEVLGMENLPQRIECYDNSNIAGQDPVSAMVVFKNGRSDKSSYRKYIIRGQELQDDYAYMYQVLERRFSKITPETPYPDLVVVDGGKGQLGMAMAVLKDLGIENRFMLAALAKKNEEKGEDDDKIYIPGRSNPLNTNQAKKALYLLQQVRDEAHRFAITFQRKQREKRAELSLLDTIKGVGPKRKQMLLTHYKGIKKMKKASIEELSALPGMNEKVSCALKKAISKK